MADTTPDDLIPDPVTLEITFDSGATISVDVDAAKTKTLVDESSGRLSQLYWGVTDESKRRLVYVNLSTVSAVVVIEP